MLNGWRSVPKVRLLINVAGTKDSNLIVSYLVILL
jgi:hypothetical protein